MKNRLNGIAYLSGTYPETFFAGANTANGFVSAYGSMIREGERTRVYVLKGGSGTGKSSLMKSCAAAAVSAGASAVMLLCSSDPSSADAVILHGREGRSVAIVDGTAPHTLDPVLPGAVGESVNLGDFWRSSDLQNARAEIASHSTQKKEAYARAYRYLAAYGEITASVRDLLSGCLLRDKMEAAAKRLTASFPREDTYGERLYYTAAVSMTGLYRLDTFSRMAKRTYAVTDTYGCGPFFLEAMCRWASDRRCSLWYAPAPGETDTPYEVYLPAASVAISVTDGEAASETDTDGKRSVVNMQRFLDRRALAACRGRLRFARRCTDMLMEGALEALAEARQHHFALESIYGSAMDFEALSVRTGEISRSILEILQ